MSALHHYESGHGNRQRTVSIFDRYRGTACRAFNGEGSGLFRLAAAAPWGNTDLNNKLLDYAAENTAAAFGFVQKLTRAKNWEDVARIQTEFMSTQLNSLNEQAKSIGDAYTKTVGAGTKTPFGTST
jgi:hypothetical protein